MFRSSGMLPKHASGLTDGPNANFAPRNLERVTVSKNRDSIAVDNQLAILGFNSARIFSVCRIVFELVYHIFQIHKRVIDGNNFDSFIGAGGPAHQPSDAAKAVDAKCQRW